MNRSIVHITTLLLAVTLNTACTPGVQRGTEVTRFHLDQPIPEQSVSLKAVDDNSIELASYSELVAAELARIGYPVTDSESTEIFVDMNIIRGMQMKPPKRSPLSVGIGAGSYGGNVGMSGGVSMPVGGGGSEVYATRLEVKFVNRAENSIVWEGRAVKETEAAPTDPNAVMQQVVKALFQDFPGESGKTVVVADPPNAN